MCSCATCHIYVHPDWIAKLPPPTPDEHALLSELAHFTERSRLSCQIALSDLLESLHIEIAPEE
jgi:2Fe-2S ferredoxin